MKQSSTTTVVIENGHQIDEDFDNDNEQWSDWEHQSEVDVFANDVPTVELSQPVSLPTKSMKLNTNSKPKWNPNAPLGSEFEIPPVVLTKNKPTQGGALKTEDPDDFFKDMAPKVETVELMKQLETMFSVNTTQSNIEPTTATQFSNKFGVLSQNEDDNQELESGNNNWDE